MAVPEKLPCVNVPSIWCLQGAGDRGQGAYCCVWFVGLAKLSGTEEGIWRGKQRELQGSPLDPVVTLLVNLMDLYVGSPAVCAPGPNALMHPCLPSTSISLLDPSSLGHGT
jgi:hypothetical protein